MANSLTEASQATQLLTQALQLGQTGFELVVQSLHHENIAVQTAAYHLLSDCPEPGIQWARLWYAPYHVLRRQFQVAGITSISENSSYPNLFAITPTARSWSNDLSICLGIQSYAPNL